MPVAARLTMFSNVDLLKGAGMSKEDLYRHLAAYNRHLAEGPDRIDDLKASVLEQPDRASIMELQRIDRSLRLIMRCRARLIAELTREPHNGVFGWR